MSVIGLKINKIRGKKEKRNQTSENSVPNFVL